MYRSRAVCVRLVNRVRTARKPCVYGTTSRMCMEHREILPSVAFSRMMLELRYNPLIISLYERILKALKAKTGNETIVERGRIAYISRLFIHEWKMKLAERKNIFTCQ